MTIENTLRKIIFKKIKFFGNNKTDKTGAQAYVLDNYDDKFILVNNYKKHGRIWAGVTENQILKLINKDIHLFEILAKYPKKVYFDIDGNPDSCNLENIKNIIKKYFVNSKLSISGYESEYRYSYHIVLNNYLIFNDDELNKLKNIVKYLSSLNSNFDWKVYTKNRLMKAVNQSKPNGMIQKIIEDKDIKNHLISCFIPTEYYTIDNINLTLSEKVSLRDCNNKFLDWSLIPQLELILPEDCDLNNPLDLLKLTPLDKNYNHSYTHKVARFCYYNNLTFEDFLSWYSKKSTSKDSIDRWSCHWNNLNSFPEITIKMYISMLKHFYKNIGFKHSAFFNAWNLPVEKIKKIDTITQDNFNDDSTALIFNIGMGGGKTFQTIEYLKTVNNFCWITPNIALADNTFNRIQENKIICNKYNTKNNKKDKADLIKNSQSIMICLNSLFYITKNYDVLVIDEIETFLKQFYNNDTLKELNDCWNVFIKLLKNSKKIILLDAFISQMTISFLDSLNIDYVIYQRNVERCPRKAIIVDNFNIWLGDIIKNIKKGKKLLIFYPYKSERKRLKLPSMKQLNELISEHTNKNGIYHNADASDYSNKLLKDVNKNWIEYDFVISNNKINVGLNFDLEYFDAVYLSIAGFNSPRDIIQFSYRTRQIKSNKIKFCYLDKNNNTTCFLKQTVDTNNDIFSNLFNYVSNEKFAPLIDTFNFFLLKAGYQTIDDKTLYDKLKIEMVYPDNDYFNYDELRDIDNRRKEMIETKIYTHRASIVDKLLIKKYYFKKQFIKDTNDQQLKELWNNNKFILINKVSNILYKDNIIEKLKNNYMWELHMPNEFKNNFKFTKDDLQLIFDNYKFKNLTTKSKHHHILKSYLNTVYGSNIIYTTKDKSKNYKYHTNSKIKDMYLLLKKILKPVKADINFN